jgi:2-hydroxychromene-2-carboxylate isomerase
MSAAEIINELPKLTEADRRAVRQRLLELAEENEAVALCDQAAIDGAKLLDRMEDEDARRQSR